MYYEKPIDELLKFPKNFKKIEITNQYDKNEKWIRAVYVLAHEDLSEVHYVGRSIDLKKRIAEHFHKTFSKEPGKYVIYYIEVPMKLLRDLEEYYTIQLAPTHRLQILVNRLNLIAKSKSD